MSLKRLGRNACALLEGSGQELIDRKNAEIVTERVNLGDLGKKTNRKRPIQDRMSSAEGTEERVDDKGDSGTYCTCECDH